MGQQVPAIDDLTPKQDDSVQIPHPTLNVSSKQVEEAFGKKMGQIKNKEFEVQAQRQAAALGFPHINLQQFPIVYEALRQIPQEIAEQKGVACFFVTQEEFRVGALDPSTEEAQEILNDIEERTHAHGALYLISEASLKHVLKLYASMPVVKPVNKDIEIKEDDLQNVQATVNDFKSLQETLKNQTTTDIVTVLLGAALKLDASDVHIEAEAERIVVRLRLDGILHDAATLAKELFARLVSRIKLTSSLKLNVTDRPQDGRFTIKLKEYDVDVRVSTIPTVYGESVVMRLLPQKKETITLENLGFRGRSFDILTREIKKPNGMIITTGPTGSGKTTTMYAIMGILNKPGVKIITLEDPVEYRVEGLNQSQVDRSKDYTFAKGLRSLLRQDPDVVMVGEIRDAETADIAVQAALTGHLMLSTVHTNSASGAIPRFISMNVKPFLLIPALNCVIGQRLVRKLCPVCRKQVQLDALGQEVSTHVHELIDVLPVQEKEEVQKKDLVFFQSVGCEKCNNIGYKGRIAICEIFSKSPKIEDVMRAADFPESEIQKVAMSEGMTTMAQDGILKALDGMTSLEEVFRVAN